MDDRVRLKNLCVEALQAKNLNGEGEKYKARLKEELKEAAKQKEASYFIDLYDRKVKYAENENNLLIPWLLGIVDEFNINEDPAYRYGEFPDIDIDYLPEVRDYLKKEWAPKTFGENNICNIGSYNTFGIKSALIDMARVFGESRDEILGITKGISPKDESGNVITWDKAMELYPALKEYCDRHPDLCDAAYRLLNRKRSSGMHAGGLIISNRRLDDLVPLMTTKTSREDGTHLSAWTEGLHEQDLGPVGLIKFDLLVITNNLQVAKICKLIKERHGIESICALPGQSDWSDTSYLNDPKALAMANDGDLKCIFQFDSSGIRQLARAGGVTSFNDLVAYSALYRPGPLNMKMHERYIERKRGREDIVWLHPRMESILGKTYGVMAYQEQVMMILNAIGGIPLKDCEIVRKAISKKKIEKFMPYKQRFVEYATNKLGLSEDSVIDLWDQIESFAEYGFNKSHACAYCYLSSRLLWLKAHYPLEFYAGILSCESQHEKIKEYKVEAARHGVHVEKIDINKSKTVFSIHEDKIYFGFSNIKGIGDDIAQRIVDGQPYESFEDFLIRFGTESKVVKPLIALKAFPNSSPEVEWAYYEKFKDRAKKKADRRNRFKKSQLKYEEDFKEFDRILSVLKEDKTVSLELAVKSKLLTKEEAKLYDEKEPVSVPSEKIEAVQEKIERLYQNARNRQERSVVNFEEKEELEKNPPSMKEFLLSADDKIVEEAAYFSEKPEQAERDFYGFIWTHPLEKCSNFNAELTFDQFKMKIESENLLCHAVQVMIHEINEKQSRKGKVYYVIKAEDSCGEIGYINVWSEDWETWKKTLESNQLFQLKLRPPSANFSSYSLYGPNQHERYKLPKNKNYDYVVIPLDVPGGILMPSEDDILLGIKPY